MFSFPTSLILAVVAGQVTSGARILREHEHAVQRSLPGSWYHAREHPSHALFRRADNSTSFPAVGSPEWINNMPKADWTTPPVSELPQAWVDALNAAVARKAIPDIPQTKIVDSNPIYPDGIDPNSAAVCSSYEQCYTATDHWQAPNGTLALNFDDGPTEFTPALIDFLKKNNETATHFMIGSNIRDLPQQFLAALNNGDDIGVHTWSHPQLTSLSNLEVVSELGYCMQAIHDSTEGRVPRYWRPPTGDADNRIRAIASEVFGLEIVLWDQDTDDWSLTDNPPGTTMQAISSEMNKWLTGPKSPGLMILEHELSNQSVSAFMAAYPLMKSNGWNIQSAARLLSGSAYRNADGLSGPVTPAGILDFPGGSGSASIVAQTSAQTSASQILATSVTINPSGTTAPSSVPSKVLTSSAVGRTTDSWTILSITLLIMIYVA